MKAAQLPSQVGAIFSFLRGICTLLPGMGLMPHQAAKVMLGGKQLVFSWGLDLHSEQKRSKAEECSPKSFPKNGGNEGKVKREQEIVYQTARDPSKEHGPAFSILILKQGELSWRWSLKRWKKCWRPTGCWRRLEGDRTTQAASGWRKKGRDIGVSKALMHHIAALHTPFWCRSSVAASWSSVNTWIFSTFFPL